MEPQLNETFKSSLPIQIRFNDIDAMGHINNNIYLSYFDLGKNAYLEAVKGSGLSWTEGAIVIAHVEMDFLKPVFYRRKVAVDSKVIRLGDKSGTFFQQIRDIENHEVKCTCKSVFVYYDAETATSVSIPPVWREAINKYEGKEL